jgi:hypothetical protein
MFKDVQADSDNMIVEIREYLDFIAPHHPNAPVDIPRQINTAKGLIYVQLYGVIESTVLRTLSKTIDYINSENIKLSELKYCALALVLDDELNSLVNSVKRKWDKRALVFSKINDDLVVSINNTLLPTDGNNITSAQLTSIWKTFGIQAPMFADLRFIDRLKDIVTNRINIAHGNTTAAEVGKLITPNDLYIKIRDVSAYCSHFIATFDSYISTKEYLLTL